MRRNSKQLSQRVEELLKKFLVNGLEPSEIKELTESFAEINEIRETVISELLESNEQTLARLEEFEDEYRELKKSAKLYQDFISAYGLQRQFDHFSTITVNDWRGSVVPN